MFSEAAGLIRHLLTVNPAKRATIDDICVHWWVNLGFNVMPNNEPYIPPMVLQPVPNFQNQSVPSSSSSSSSSSSESDDGDSPASANKSKTVKPLKGILKKPKMNTEERLQNIHTNATQMNCITATACNKQCNESKAMSDIENCENPQEKALAASEDAVFTELVQSKTSRPAVSSTLCGSAVYSTAQSSRGMQATCDVQASNDRDENVKSAILNSSSSNTTVPFDSKLIPKRGILKRKGKFSAGDSGCEMNDPQSKESAVLSVRPMDLNGEDSALDSPDNIKQVNASPSDSKGNTITPAGAFNFSSNESQTNKSLVTMPDGKTTVLVSRRKGILKNASRDSDKRLSACSIGSNSSADILDFSYDSSDETLLTKFCKNSGNGESKEFCMEVREIHAEGHTALNTDLFNYMEAKDVYEKALELCKDF